MEIFQDYIKNQNKIKKKGTVIFGETNAYVLPKKDISKIKIGRGTNNDIVIGYPTTSRSHCAIIGGEKYQGNFYIVDENSKNGTYLNEEKVTSDHKKYWLKKGDKIAVANDLVLSIGTGPINNAGIPINKHGDAIGKIKGLEVKLLSGN